jgi:hypothetical protein
MSTRRNLALAGATAALSLLTAGSALAAGPAVSVRIEGLKQTLLTAKTVHAESGSITKGNTPAGMCPGSSAAGALDRATHHRWDGTYSSGLGIEVTKLLGETHVYSPKGHYWGIWVDNRFASAGICGLTLHKGERLLFAPVPASGSISVTAIKAPHNATRGKSFTVKVSYYTTKGRSKPLAGAKIDGRTTNGNGVARITPRHTGKLKLTASAKGYIRSEATVSVR